jgi:CheY-like chemotaxis protein
MISGGPIIILLGENEPAHAEIIRRNLEGFRMANRLINVSDSQAALDYIYRKKLYDDVSQFPDPGLILLDLSLHKVDGLEVLKIIKSDPKKRHLPVVVLTASTAETGKIRAYVYRTNNCQVKPVELSGFLEMMKSQGFYWLVWNEFPYLPD